MQSNSTPAIDKHHHQPTDANDLINLLLQGALGDGLPRIAEILMNAAMLVERTKHLAAGPYECVEARNGHANGFKPRAFHTSMGGLDLAMPQVRGSDFGAASLGEGDPVAGANLLASMASSIANISPPGSGLKSPNGASFLVSGSHASSLIAEKLGDLGDRQNNLNSHLRAHVRSHQEKSPRRLGTWQPTHARHSWTSTTI